MNKKVAAIICTAAVVLSVGGTYAYLTDSENVINEFTVGKVDIDLDEPSWEPDDHQELVPLEEIAKDPQITNVGKNDAFVFLEVSIPKRELVLADSAGNRLPKQLVPVFTFESNEGWELIDTKNTNEIDTYTYAYDQILSPDDTTGTLFDTVTFQNVIEGQIDGEAFEIPVNAYAIQSLHTGDNKTEIIDQAKAAYAKFRTQNAKANNGMTDDQDDKENGSDLSDQP